MKHRDGWMESDSKDWKESKSPGEVRELETGRKRTLDIERY